MKIMTVAKLAAIGGAAYWVKQQGGVKPAFERLKSSMKSLAEQTKPIIEDAAASVGSSSTRSDTGGDVGTGIGSSARSGSTFGNKTNY
jgi:hypothetical protein